MGERTAIEWATKTWEVMQGCNQVSPGCARCWAKRLAEGRLRRFYPGGFEQVEPKPSKLMEPVRWKTPQRVFVSSRSDFFHKQISDRWRDMCFATMREAPQHTFLLLTKRAEKLAVYHPKYADGSAAPWPPNVWAGVSVEYQRWANHRVPLLLQSSARIRWVSVEPILGPIELRPWLPKYTWDYGNGEAVDWVVVGDESGKGRRPAKLEWIRSLRDQCQEAGGAFYFKQWHGAGQKISLPLLDGQQWAEWPADLRVREMP